jgi:hypothetical protein
MELIDEYLVVAREGRPDQIGGAAFGVNVILELINRIMLSVIAAKFHRSYLHFPKRKLYIIFVVKTSE